MIQTERRRNTRQRQIVLDVVRAHHDHPRAEEIYEEVSTIDSHISRGTVYRNLNCLAYEGMITHVRVPGADRYDSRTDRHYHLICMSCGATTDIDLAYRTKTDKMIESRYGYKVNRHRVIAEGICPECQKKMQKDGR